MARFTLTASQAKSVSGMLALVFLAATGATVFAAEPPITDCDRLAAHPDDSERVAEGLLFEDIDAESAIEACEQALGEFPQTPRFLFQLGRANLKAENNAITEQTYRAAAELGHLRAQALLGYLLWEQYQADNAPPEILSEVARWWREAAQSGDLDAQADLGILLFFDTPVKNLPEAMRWLTIAAEAGIARAQFYLGMAYVVETGSAHSPTLATHWIRKAAEQGISDAQYALGLYHRIGFGVPQDDAEAARWFRMAVEQDYADAEWQLGLMHSEGKGVPEDLDLAVRLLERAVEHGNVEAAVGLGDVLRKRDSAKFLENEEAIASYRYAAERDSAAGQQRLSTLFMNSYLLVPDAEKMGVMKEALHWWREAEAQGDELVTRFNSVYVGLFHMSLDNGDVEGEAARLYLDTAIPLIKSAAERGNASAQQILGALHKDGLAGYISKDREQAIHWYGEAAKQGDAHSAEQLEELKASAP